MAASILNVNPPAGLTALGGDEAKLQIQISNVTSLEINQNSLSLNGVFWENSKTVTADYTISINKNAMSAGPITINDGVTVTINDGSEWSIV